MRLVEFAYKPEIAQKWGLNEQDRHRVGVIAQGKKKRFSFISNKMVPLSLELAEVLPEAVRDNGEFLTVDG